MQLAFRLKGENNNSFFIYWVQQSKMNVMVYDQLSLSSLKHCHTHCSSALSFKLTIVFSKWVGWQHRQRRVQSPRQKAYPVPWWMPLAALTVAILKHQSHPWIWRAVQLTHLCNYYKPTQKAKIDWNLFYVTFIIKILKH